MFIPNAKSAMGGRAEMPILWYNSGITDQDRVKLLELYHELGGDVRWFLSWMKRLDGELAVKDRVESSEEIGRLMRQTRRYFK